MTSNAQSILLIEDEPQMRRFLKAGFELDGFHVEEADTGGGGVRLATLRSFDIHRIVSQLLT